MTAIRFEDATRDQIHFKGALHGPGGSGKTYTMLSILHALCPSGRIAVIDTERGRAQKYVGVNGWAFKIFKPTTFSPASLVEILGVCAREGFEGVGLDSWSQYWSGAEGMLEQVDKSSGSRNDRFGGGWKTERPHERRMMDAILGAEFHIVTTLRVKVDYVVEEVIRDGRKVSAPRKVGLRPEQRDSFEYEMDLVGDLDVENTLTVVKSDMITVPQGTVIPKPGIEFGTTIAEFCSEGFAPIGPAEYRSQALSVSATRDQLIELFNTVTRAGLAGAPVAGADGEPTVLAELIKARGREIDATTRGHLTAVPDPTPTTPPALALAAGWDGCSPEALTALGDLLYAATKDEANTVLARVRGTDVGREDILPLLADVDIEILGIPPTTERATLINLGARVVAYVNKHAVAVRAATAEPVPPAQDDPVEDIRVADIAERAAEHRAALAAAGLDEDPDAAEAARQADLDEIAKAEQLLAARAARETVPS